MKWYHYALAGLALASLGFAFGRYAAPDKVVTVDRVVEREVVKEDFQAREQVVALTEQVRQLKQKIKRQEHTVSKPDGTVETTITEEIETNEVTDTATDTTSSSEVVASSSTETESATEHVEVVERSRPDWKLSGLVAVDAPAALRGNLTPAYGVLLERRILGPVSAGVWGLSSGVVGAALTVEF